MTTHLALLRGINVSGHHLIKMDALVTALQNAGFSNVTTYLQTGNVFIDSEEINAASVGFKIRQEITKAFGHDVPIVVINIEDLKACLSNNPFIKDQNHDIKKLYVAFMSKSLQAGSINDLKISQIKPDEASIDASRLFIKYDVNPGKTRLDEKYIEKKLNVIAVIRNYNTVNALLRMYEEKAVSF